MKREQSGSGHPLVIVLIIVVIAAIGAAGYFVFNKQRDKNSGAATTALTKQEVKQLNEECKKQYNDEDLCKFMSSWTDMKRYQVTSSSTAGSETSNFLMEIDGSDKTHMVITQNGTESYNVITIGKVTYTKDNTDGKWWKQTAESTEAETAEDEFKFDTSDDIKDDGTVTTQYKFITKEACGSKTCFKYQVIDPSSTDTTQFVWFDDKDYLLRRWTTEEKDGSKSDASFAYEKVEVSEPSPTKDVQPGQVIIPGGGAMTVPQAEVPTEDQPADIPVDDSGSEE